MWKSLKLSDGTSDGVITDSFGFEKYQLNVGEWDSEYINCGKEQIEFEIECVGITGSGTLTYKESVDRINWTAVQASETDVTLAITTTEVHRIKDFTVVPNTWKRLDLTEGTLSAGYLVIKAIE